MNNHLQIPHQIIEELAEIAEYLWQKGWAERNAGNFSVNMSELLIDKNITTSTVFYNTHKPYPALSNKLFVISASGSRMRDLAKHPSDHLMLVKMNSLGNAYSVDPLNKKNTKQPTSELDAHLSIHAMIAERGSNEKAILHTHTTELIAITHCKSLCNTEALNHLICNIHPEINRYIPEGIGFVPFYQSGSSDIAQNTTQVLMNHKIALCEKHGVFSINETMTEAFDLVDMIAKAAKIHFMYKQIQD